MSRIAIAGASGFVGRNLIKVLAPHHQVRALGRSKQAGTIQNVE